jgi:predicted RNA-binding protein with PIN domain
MTLLIDGYNLIHSAGLVAQPPGPGGLERARRALCEFLAASLAETERGRTTVVFDARQAPPDREHVYVYQGITVRFAVDYNEADELIEELIERDSAPRQLTVVSSDHRLHRAARRRRAKAVDSDVWYAELVRPAWPDRLARRIRSNLSPGPRLARRRSKPGRVNWPSRRMTRSSRPIIWTI